MGKKLKSYLPFLLLSTIYIALRTLPKAAAVASAAQIAQNFINKLLLLPLLMFNFYFKVLSLDEGDDANKTTRTQIGNKNTHYLARFQTQKTDGYYVRQEQERPVRTGIEKITTTLTTIETTTTLTFGSSVNGSKTVLPSNSSGIQRRRRQQCNATARCIALQWCVSVMLQHYSKAVVVFVVVVVVVFLSLCNISWHRRHRRRCLYVENSKKSKGKVCT